MTPVEDQDEHGGRPETRDEALLGSAGPGCAELAEDDPAHVERMAAEIAQGFNALRDVHQGVSIFGSARTPSDSAEYETARATGALLGQQGFTIITGGGPGIMEAANRGAHEVGARSVGLNIELPHAQTLNPYVDLQLRFEHFFIRKVMFVRYASAFVVFPGGLGTLDELFEARVLIQTRKIRHFPVVLVGSTFWSGLLGWEHDELLTGGKVDRDDLGGLHVVDEPAQVAQIVQDAFDAQSQATLARAQR